MKVFQFTAAILVACFMHAASGLFVVSSAPVNSATLKHTLPTVELAEGKQVLDAHGGDTDAEDFADEYIKGMDEEGDGDDEDYDEMDEEDDEGLDEEDDEGLDEDDDGEDEDPELLEDEQDEEGQRDEQDFYEPDEEFDRVKERVAAMSQPVKDLYAKAEQRVRQTLKEGASDEAHAAADQAVKAFSVAFEKERSAAVKLGEQQVAKNPMDGEYAEADQRVPQTLKEGSSDVAHAAAAVAAKNHMERMHEHLHEHLHGHLSAKGRSDSEAYGKVAPTAGTLDQEAKLYRDAMASSNPFASMALAK